MTMRRRFLSLSFAALALIGLGGCTQMESSPTLKGEHLVDSAVATVERLDRKSVV